MAARLLGRLRLAAVVGPVAQIMAAAVDPSNVAGLPERLCAACVRALELDGAAISVMTGPAHGTVLSASDEAAGRVERLQHTLGEGPCVEAFATDRAVLVADLTGTDGNRWPVLAAELAGWGTPVRSVSAFPLGVGEIRLGVLGLYRAHPGEMSGERLLGARMAVDAASVALAGSFSVARTVADGWPPWLTEPSVDGVVVDQAVGMIMVQAGLGPESSLARLRAHAFTVGRPVDEVAREVVERRLRFGAEPRTGREN